MATLPPLPTRLEKLVGFVVFAQKKNWGSRPFSTTSWSRHGPRDWRVGNEPTTGIDWKVGDLKSRLVPWNLFMSLFLGSPYPSLKLIFSHLKMDGWNTIVSFWDGLFSGPAVSFRECNRWDRWYIITQKRQEKYHLGLPLIVLAFCGGYMLPIPPIKGTKNTHWSSEQTIDMFSWRESNTLEIRLLEPVPKSNKLTGWSSEMRQMPVKSPQKWQSLKANAFGTI